MKAAFVTHDGGTGKTAMSLAVALELDYYLFSNDDSVIEQAYPDGAKIMKNPPVMNDSIYDFGGFAESGVIDIIKECDIVIVPCINDLNSTMKAIKTIKELEPYAKKFLVIATRLESDKDYKEVKTVIRSVFKEIEVLPLRKTKMLKNCLELGTSPLDLVSESKKVKYDGRKFIPEYLEVLKFIIDDDKKYNDLIGKKGK